MPSAIISRSISFACERSTIDSGLSSHCASASAASISSETLRRPRSRPIRRHRNPCLCRRRRMRRLRYGASRRHRRGIFIFLEEEGIDAIVVALITASDCCTASTAKEICCKRCDRLWGEAEFLQVASQHVGAHGDQQVHRSDGLFLEYVRVPREAEAGEERCDGHLDVLWVGGTTSAPL